MPQDEGGPCPRARRPRTAGSLRVAPAGGSRPLARRALRRACRRHAV